MFDPAIFAARREAYMKALGPHAMAVIRSLPERLRNGDAHHRFRQHSDLVYLTGFLEPDTVRPVRDDDSMRFEDILFTGNDLHAYLELKKREMLNAIEGVPRDVFLKASVDDMVKNFGAMHAVDPIRLHADKTYVDDQEVSIPIEEIPDGRFFFSTETSSVPGTMVTFHVPFEGDQSLFHLRGSSWFSSMPRAEVRHGELVFSFKSQTPSPGQLKGEFDRQRNLVDQLVANSSAIVEKFNQDLNGAAQAAIDARREKLLKAQNTVGALGFPMRRRADAAETYSVPTVRKKIAFTAPPSREPFKPEPALNAEQYEDILRVLESMAHVLERSPSAFEKIDEEALRMHFLVALNGQFEGAATGETFNANGKTDILIRVGDKNIFIAECKFWHGPDAFAKTIDQLLGYLSWRDTKTAILLFNRDTQMSTVVGKIPALLEAHPHFKRSVPQAGETRFRVILGQPTDLNREVSLTVLVFHVPK
jgi:hypothetical protein